MMKPGLKGIIAAETAISYIDGHAGELLYRGYRIEELAEKGTFEATAYLLLFGEYPDRSQVEYMVNELKRQRELPAYMMDMIKELPGEMDMMSVLRTIISAEGTDRYSWKPTVEQAIRLCAITPVIIAFRKRYLEGKPLVSPNPNMNHVSNYLYMLNGEEAKDLHVHALETYMILTMEHGMNASTFSARVTSSTESDLVSAISAAIGAMKGPLHGGAPSGVISLLDRIHAAGNTEEIIREKLAKGERIMGFGHRVYKTKDPRAVALKKTLMAFAGDDAWLDLAVRVEDETIALLQQLKPGRNLYTNVEFYAAAIMKSLSMDSGLFTPTFTAARIVGWCAHVLEQSENNVLFRPEAAYIGNHHA
ncbi:citrate synthase/methylcitrate synthase [Bacillus testis]|uniref:citrate synthase/methylcitrate synthase n=1 Tax=Bacillus testis TaxID=1622072 RepID=UPI00067E911D|nr:citrate synthase/methylcitrate synthase [Bacillus testis]